MGANDAGRVAASGEQFQKHGLERLVAADDDLGPNVIAAWQAAPFLAPAAQHRVKVSTPAA